MALPSTLPQDPSDRIRYLARRIALELDPSGELQVLAAEYGWAASTLSEWIRRGSVPSRIAKALHARFGAQIGFEVSDLCPLATFANPQD